ncbi:DUF3618 domain-containing protein [Methylopila sp. Yamaguchi]|uniref:DUF3618 domain-containing protein n=1 Tax=Methylopila sp. Yamaguchi TaxID=1437817 RepID=UPI000CB513A5|nr:DUF3618 domain-containing protein [Methylopila sp. Yamaguchi]GBD50214.1 hypothetical protein METY_3427 [Methylopila sp. Yamaguchi]
MTKSTSELERDAERTRADLAATLNDIRTRMEPGRLVDQAFSYARSNGGADFARNAAAQARDNPLPILLIGAGLAWLMSGRKPASGLSVGGLQSAGVRKTHDARDMAAGAASTVSDAVSSASASLKGAFAAGASGVGAAGSKAGSLADSAGSAVRSGGEQLGNAASELQRLCAENPLVVGAIGLAIGAVLGAALPNTETENRLMGAEADELKSTLKAKADEQIERGERAVRAGLEEARRSDSPTSAQTTGA